MKTMWGWMAVGALAPGLALAAVGQSPVSSGSLRKELGLARSPVLKIAAVPSAAGTPGMAPQDAETLAAAQVTPPATAKAGAQGEPAPQHKGHAKKGKGKHPRKPGKGRKGKALHTPGKAPVAHTLHQGRRAHSRGHRGGRRAAARFQLGAGPAFAAFSF